MILAQQLILFSLSLFLIFTKANVLDTSLTYETLNYDSNGGDKIGIMTSGDVDDFGYNYIINAGRVDMERRLNMSGSFWLPNIHDNVTAIKAGIELVQKGCKMVLSGTFVHGTAMPTLAQMYPNVSFIRYGTTKFPGGIPNLSSAGYLNPEFWFAVGVFSGITSMNNKVGFVHPGPIPGTIQSINAFYSGVKYANSSVEVYAMYTGDFIAPDRARGACKRLISEIKVGSLTGQQNDLVVPRAAMDAGLLGIGVNGFSLRGLYGELVGMSFLRDWGVILSKYATLSLNDNVFSNDTFASFKNGGQYPDKKSFHVTDAQMAVLENAIKQISLKPTLYLCIPELSQYSTFNTTTGCVTSLQFNNDVYSDVKVLGYYDVPLVDQPFPESSRVGIIVTTGILLAIPAILIIVVIILRNNKEIQSGSPFFFLIMLVGCIIVYVGVIMWPMEPSVNRCYARIWLPSIGATLAISALITKNLRIFLLFFNPFRFRGEKLKLKYYVPVVLVMLLLDVMLLVIYTSVGPEGVHVQKGTNGLGIYETRHICATSESGNNIVYAILAYHMLQLIIGCVVSFMLRNVTEKQYNERKAVAMAIYVVTFCLLIAAVLIGVTDISNEQTIIFVTLALLVANTGVLIIIFGSRFVNLVMEPPQEILKASNNSSTKSSGSKGSNHSKGSTEEYASGTANTRPNAQVYTV